MGASRTPVVVLEFNELSPALMDRFIAEGHLPNFRRLRDRARRFVTDAGEQDDRLNPWVQWVTVHTGATAGEHGVGRLGEGRNLDRATVGDLVGAAGGTVWLCGPMNVVPRSEVRGAWLPDPWSTGVVAQPADLEDFAAVVRANVQEHTSATAGVSRREYLRFAAFAARHGLRPRTVVAGARQLLGERLRRRPRGHRALVLDRLQWDVFWWYHRRLRPDFATFFSNSTAHFQHLHWGDEDAVLVGYRAMDRLVGEALARIGDDATIVLCTALSQRANTEGRLDYDGFHRPEDVSGIADALGLPGVVEVAPVMAEQFHLRFADPDQRAVALALLRGAEVVGASAFDVQERGDDLLVGARPHHPVAADATLAIGDRSLRFLDLFYWVEAPRAGTHDGEGILWIHDPRRPGGDGGRVPLEQVAPTLLELLGVPRSPAMQPALTTA